MKKLFSNLKYIQPYDILSIFIFIALVIPALIYKLYLRITHQRIWLITEDGHYARDNGYYFFKYMRTEHKDFRAYYVIDKKAHDYQKVEKYGNIVQFRSLKHWIYYMSDEYNISSQKNGNPAQALFYILHVKLNLFNNRVFLQHGIILNKTNYVFYNETKFKYLVCGAKREYDYIKENFAYPDGSLLPTGLARFDNLSKPHKIKNNQILIMPSWRSWLGRETNAFTRTSDFEQTTFYKNWNGLLNDPTFIDFIEKNNLTVKFYPHINMQKFLSDFHPASKNIELISTETDIQQIMKESAIMITDYSSVSVDFAYMKKPIIYYQFDQKEYREKQYEPSYFNYEKDGFGPVTTNIGDTFKALKNFYKNGAFTTVNKFSNRARDFFSGISTGKSCQNIYLAISNKLQANKQAPIIKAILPILYFCYIFMFNIYGPIDSSVLVGGLLCMILVFNKKFRKHTINLFKKQPFKKSLILFSIILVWGALSMLANQSSDFSLFKNLTKIAITLVTGYLLYSATDYSGQSTNIVNYVLISFIAQTIFQWTCFISPNFSNVFNCFRDVDAIEIAKRYTGFRGLALTKSPYFTLSVSYAISFILYLSKFNSLFKNHKIIKFTFFIILVSGNIFAGRVGFIGLAFIPFMINWRQIKFHKPTKYSTIALIATITIISGAVLTIFTMPQTQKLQNYVFEATNNLFSGDGLKTGSTNKLIKMFDRPLSTKTLLIGDGRFVNNDGTYYMKTDIGYYRKIYFGGIIFLLLIIAWHFSLFDKKNKEFVLITILLLIAEIKGVTIGQNSMVYAIIIMYILCSIIHNKKLSDSIKASILFPTLNTNEQYLKTAIGSILSQTHTNFEFIIISDGGNDDEYITKNFSDNRIKIIKHEKPRGIAKSLNEAIEKSSGKYLIRMDADDISRNTRLEEQIIYMEEHPDITVASTFIRKFGSAKVTSCESFISPNDVYVKSIINDPIAHPSVIMRASTIKESGYFYDPSYERAEDYELWRRIMNDGHKITIMRYFGLYYRVHSSQVSTAKRKEQLAQVKRIQEAALEDLRLPKTDVKYLFMLGGHSSITDKRDLKQFIKKAVAKNKKLKVYSQRSFKKILYSSYDAACFRNKLLVFPNRYFISMCIHKIYYKILCTPATIHKKRYN